jgi:hypothetical protein
MRAMCACLSQQRRRPRAISGDQAHNVCNKRCMVIHGAAWASVVRSAVPMPSMPVYRCAHPAGISQATHVLHALRG